MDAYRVALYLVIPVGNENFLVISTLLGVQALPSGKNGITTVVFFLYLVAQALDI